MTHTGTAAGPIGIGIWPNRLILGRGSMDRLAGLVRDLGATRALVVCGRTVANGPMLERTKLALGSAFCGVFDRVVSHTPLTMVDDLSAIVEALSADAVVTVGGGSAIDAGKGFMLRNMASGALDEYAVRYDDRGVMKQRRLPESKIVHVAVPTTSGSASEVMPTAGIRDVATRRKLLFWDDALIPHGVILDPEMAAHTGPALTAASGMTAVARCVESLYSAFRNPLAEGLALHALRLLHRNLPVVVDKPHDLDARYECQVACSMSGMAAINSMVSVVHALGHIVGGKFALQHGVSHAILLGPAMRRLLSTIGERQTLVLEALDGGRSSDPDEAGRASAQCVEALVRRLPLKASLRELGIPETDLREIAEQASRDYMMINLPRPMDVPEIEELLRLAW
ncbi:MAG TPA: iron-containing alcohol dehydrogenase family protein [Candidatus Acidoferrales bacterium]|nr:iron-containing alcohol dehydrogenase family protein [Candidatus Acidoferrales bacterium]